MGGFKGSLKSGERQSRRSKALPHTILSELEMIARRHTRVSGLSIRAPSPHGDDEYVAVWSV